MHEAFWNGLFDVRWEEAPLGPEAIRLVRRLRERGYAERTCRDYGHAVVHLGRYLHEERESDRGSKTSEPPKVMLSSVQSAILLTPADPAHRHHDKEGHRARSHNPQLHITRGNVELNILTAGDTRGSKASCSSSATGSAHRQSAGSSRP